MPGSRAASDELAGEIALLGWREHIRARRGRSAAAAEAEVVTEEAPPLFAMDNARVATAGLFNFSLAQAFDYPAKAFVFDGALVSSLGAASVLAMYSYGGYNQVCNIGDEIKDPSRTIPRSIVLSTFIVAAS